jgi:hypothetical protein
MQKNLTPENIFNNIYKRKENLLHYFYRKRDEVHGEYTVNILIINSSNLDNLEIIVSLKLNRLFSRKESKIFFLEKPKDWDIFLSKHLDDKGFIKD